MNVACGNCKKIIPIPDDKVPQNKDRAKIICPHCKKIVVFDIPAIDSTVIINPNIKKDHSVYLTDISNGNQYLLKIGKNTIGRSSDICISNEDNFISRKHCTIEVIEKNGVLTIILSDEFPSRNGTFYHDKRLELTDKLVLKDGEQIRIGRTYFMINFK